VQNYLDTLRREGVQGRQNAAALLSLPPAEWECALATNPHWLRVGTFQVLLDEAEDVLVADCERAILITTFVARHAERTPVPLHAWSLWTKVRCDAWTTHGNVLLAFGEYDATVNASYLAENVASDSALLLQKTDAKHLRARAWGRMERDTEALDLLDECLQVYGYCGHACRYIRVLGSRAILLCDMRQWSAAWHTLREAETTARDVRYPPITLAYEAMLHQCRESGLPDDGETMKPISLVASRRME
jgi:hypothetical protein